MRRSIPPLVWFAAAALVAGALGRRAIDRLMYSATEISLGWYVAPRIDIADVIFGGALAVAALPFALRDRPGRPWLARTGLALGLLAVVFLPGVEDKLERAGRDWFGPYGDRVSAGLEFFVLVALAALAVGLCARCARSPRGPAPVVATLVLAAFALEAWVPATDLRWSALVAAPLTLLLIRLPPAAPEEPSP